MNLAVTTEDGDESLLGVRGPEDLLGELAALDSQNRLATVIAIEPLTVQSLTAEEFRSFIAEHSSTALELIRMLMTKAPVVRGIAAGMFAISTAAAGLALATSAAGAAPEPRPNCTAPPEEAAATVPTQPEPVHCATLKVTKVVTGAPAPGTTFAVGVDCA